MVGWGVGGLPLSFAPQTKPGSFQGLRGGQGRREHPRVFSSSLKERDSSRF